MDPINSLLASAYSKGCIKDLFLTCVILDLSVCGQSLYAGRLYQKFPAEGAWPWQVGIFQERLDVFSVSCKAAKVMTNQRISVLENKSVTEQDITIWHFSTSPAVPKV